MVVIACTGLNAEPRLAGVLDAVAIGADRVLVVLKLPSATNVETQMELAIDFVANSV